MRTESERGVEGGEREGEGGIWRWLLFVKHLALRHILL